MRRGVENRVTAENAQPLADDVTAEELAARPEQPRAPRSKSTEEAYASSANKWWPMFLKAVCWDGTEKGVFIDAAGDPISTAILYQFLYSIGPGGIPTYVLAPNKETVARLWEEYTTGLNGGPAVRNLIHD